MSYEDIFSDVYAHKVNFVTRIETRTKIAFIAIALAINLLSPTVYTPIAITLFCLAILMAVGIPLKLVALRLTAPLVIASVVLITQIFFYGTTPMFTISVLGFKIAAYEEGIARGILLMCRVIGGVSLVLLLGMSTPVNKLLSAAAWFRMPKTLVELGFLVYRYIFVLLEEFLNLRDAQKVRLGYRNWRQSMRSLSILGASLFLRAYDRSNRVFEAMIARGYGGAMTTTYIEGFSRKDYITAICLIFILAAFYFIGWLPA